MIKKKKFDREARRAFKIKLIISSVIGIILGFIVYLIYLNLWISIITFILTVVVIILLDYVIKVLKRTARIRKLEDIFPDFLQLMSSNLRAGMTIDRSMLLSARPEFAPLDSEILQTGKDIVTGKDIEKSLLLLAERLQSEKIHKTILLLISGIRAGGDIAILLEETSVSMRERAFVEKKAASSVLMYMVFIFLAVSIFSPFLFSLSTVLVEVLTNILSGLPETQSNMNLPFTLSKLSISTNFIMIFSIVFMLVIDVFASLVLGLVGKGDEKQGVKYIPVIMGLSIIIFFIARKLILQVLSGVI